MYKKLPGGLGDVQVVFEEAMNGEEGLMVQRINGTRFKDLFQEGLAEGGGQLVNQPGNTQVVIADDRLVRIKNLADLQGDLCLLKGCLLYTSERLVQRARRKSPPIFSKNQV